ncbi:hypothetical protein [Streptomyces sp. NPDC057460]
MTGTAARRDGRGTHHGTLHGSPLRDATPYEGGRTVLCVRRAEFTVCKG